MEEAMALIAARMESGGRRRKRARQDQGREAESHEGNGNEKAKRPQRRLRKPRAPTPESRRGRGQEAEISGQEIDSKSGEQGALAVPRKKDSMDVKSKRAEEARSRRNTKEDILQFIRSSSANIGRREIARAFNIKGSDRIDLKRMLKELAADGLIADTRRGMRKARCRKSRSSWFARRTGTAISSARRFIGTRMRTARRRESL